MFVFRMNSDCAGEFFKRCQVYKVKTPEACMAVAKELAMEGKVSNVIFTARTEAEYVNDLNVNFADDAIDAIWCADSDTGDRCLVDRTTGTILVRLNGGKRLL